MSSDSNDGLGRRGFLAGAGIAGLGVALVGLGQRPWAAEPDYGGAAVTLLAGTPKDDGFHFPAEWARHDFTIMVFPPRQNWAGYGLAAARRDWAAVANAVAEFEPVLMVAYPGDARTARHLISAEIELVELPVNDSWSRDSGPMFVVDGRGRRRVARFTFNGWGAKFVPYADDALLKARLCQHLNTPIYPASLVLEGGTVAMDGEGTVITTEQCLLHANRNPGLDKTQVEETLKAYLGAKKIIWLGEGIVPDPITDGHVDGICAFVAPGLVLLHTTDYTSDPNHRICEDARRRLQEATDAQGRRFEIIELPLALDVAHKNFYIANGGVIVPIANDRRQDDAPMAIIREVFPARQVVGVDGNVLAQGGGVHCITQQVPAV